MIQWIRNLFITKQQVRSHLFQIARNNVKVGLSLEKVTKNILREADPKYCLCVITPNFENKIPLAVIVGRKNQYVVIREHTLCTTFGNNQKFEHIKNCVVPHQPYCYRLSSEVWRKMREQETFVIHKIKNK